MGPSSSCASKLAVALCVFLCASETCLARSIVKRSPQLSLTVVDEPETTPRQHPPSPEDLEERRQALVKALIPGSGGDGRDSSGVGGQLQSLADLGVDLIGGTVMNAGELFAPLTNATKKARENFPRAGDVINRLVDSARDYRKNVGSVLQQVAGTGLNNGIRIFTTVSSRGGEVIGGIFKLVRTLLDNFTYAIQNLVQTLSRGIRRFAEISSNLLGRGVRTAKGLANNERLLAPAKIATEIGTDFVKGLASDFNMAQPWVNDGVKSKLTLGAALVPRFNIATILSPLADPEKPHDEHEKEVSDAINEEISKLVDGNISKKDDGASSPFDLLDIVASSKSERQVEPESDTATKSSSTKTVTTEGPESNEVDESAKAKSSSTTTTPTKSPTTSTTGSNTSLEELFGIDTKS